MTDRQDSPSGEEKSGKGGREWLLIETFAWPDGDVSIVNWGDRPRGFLPVKNVLTRSTAARVGQAIAKVAETREPLSMSSQGYRVEAVPHLVRDRLHGIQFWCGRDDDAVPERPVGCCVAGGFHDQNRVGFAGMGGDGRPPSRGAGASRLAGNGFRPSHDRSQGIGGAPEDRGGASRGNQSGVLDHQAARRHAVAVALVARDGRGTGRRRDASDRSGPQPEGAGARTGGAPRAPNSRSVNRSGRVSGDRRTGRLDPHSLGARHDTAEHDRLAPDSARARTRRPPGRPARHARDGPWPDEVIDTRLAAGARGGRRVGPHRRTGGSGGH
ncbi:DUF5593 domain-containing protein [Nocardia terpenica]